MYIEHTVLRIAGFTQILLYPAKHVVAVGSRSLSRLSDERALHHDTLLSESSDMYVKPPERGNGDDVDSGMLFCAHCRYF